MHPGRTVQLLGCQFTATATGAETNHAYALFVVSIPPGGGLPPHRQYYDDAAFLILEGSFDILDGERTTAMKRGDYRFIPRGAPRGARNQSLSPGRFLLIVSPGGIFEQFLAELGELPSTFAGPVAIAPPDERWLVSAEKYGIELVAR